MATRHKNLPTELTHFPTGNAEVFPVTVPLRRVLKKILIYLYCHALMPKGITQRVYDLLKLREH